MVDSGADPAFVPAGPSQCSLSRPTGFNPGEGDTFTIVYPFVRSSYTVFDESGPSECPTWRPGHRYEETGPEDIGEVADAEGGVTFTVVGTFKPGRFPTRVFYTRQFTDPDGKTFGKTRLHIATLDKFRRLTRGYRFAYGIGEPPRTGVDLHNIDKGLACLERADCLKARAHTKGEE